jgi:ATP-dependent Clp endopeptidase proteolytic subunit ClpP
MNNLIQIENKAGKVRLNETVTEDSIRRMIDEIGKLFGATACAQGADFGTIMNATENGIDILDIEINSPGGSVFDGYTIYNEIRSLRERGVVVNARITGMAASMASVIAMAASKVLMASHARMMIHDASAGISGNAEAMRRHAELLDSISADLANIYAERTGKDVEEIRDMMKKETWMNAQQAIDNGFADEVFDIRPTMPTKKPMNLIQAIKDLLPSVSNDDADKLAAHVNEVEALSADLISAQAQIDELKGLSAVVAEKDMEISNLTAAATSYQAEIVTKDETITNLQTELATAKTEIETAKESAGTQAIEVLASIGQPEPLIDANASAEPEDLIKTLAKLKGAERTEYYAKHGEEIRKLLTK